MTAERIRGPAGGAEGFRAARRALQGLARPGGEPKESAGAGASPTRRDGEMPAAPTGRILSISVAEARSGVRAHKVAEARERIAQGYYNRPDVRSELINSLMRSFGELE